jgi:hypothetical protein
LCAHICLRPSTPKRSNKERVDDGRRKKIIYKWREKKTSKTIISSAKMRNVKRNPERRLNGWNDRSLIGSRLSASQSHFENLKYYKYIFFVSYSFQFWDSSERVIIIHSRQLNTHTCTCMHEWERYISGHLVILKLSLIWLNLSTRDEWWNEN